MMCAITGCSVEASALAIIANSRVRRFAIFNRWLSVGEAWDMKSFHLLQHSKAVLSAHLQRTGN
jgi:hypothetical protein